MCQQLSSCRSHATDAAPGASLKTGFLTRRPSQVDVESRTSDPSRFVGTKIERQGGNFFGFQKSTDSGGLGHDLSHDIIGRNSMAVGLLLNLFLDQRSTYIRRADRV
jgi:hypothetical protein